MTYGIAVQNNSVLKGSDSRVTEEPVVSGRITLAPVNTEDTTVHVGLSASMENGSVGEGARFRGRGKLPATDLGTSRTLAEAGVAAGAEDKEAQHLGLEVAGAMGPFYAQAEYVQASYSDAYDGATGPEDADVAAYYLMASWFVTGEHKPYKGGVFKSPKPASEIGAWELKARYDFAENKDQPTSATNEREISVLTVGTNWYLNPNTRFMLEYSMGEDNTTQVAGSFVEPKAVTLRTQFSF
jgi:phosphate-selective porin OprO/OprP